MIRHLLTAAIIAISFFGMHQNAKAQDELNSASAKPLQMMRELSVLEGRWSMVMEITNDGGTTWQSMPPEIIDVSFRQKGMLIAEIPTDLSTPAFHMETYIGYDQYRDVYRKIAVDDVWGLVDIYEGDLKDNIIIFDNLKSGTTFPIGEDKWRHFKLHLELASPRRTLIIEKSDDNGSSWQMAFRVTYELLPNTN